MCYIGVPSMHWERWQRVSRTLWQSTVLSEAVTAPIDIYEHMRKDLGVSRGAGQLLTLGNLNECFVDAAAAAAPASVRIWFLMVCDSSQHWDRGCQQVTDSFPWSSVRKHSWYWQQHKQAEKKSLWNMAKMFQNITCSNDSQSQNKHMHILST